MQTVNTKHPFSYPGCMLAKVTKANHIDWYSGWFAEPKIDGMRFSGLVQPLIDYCQLHTRSGSTYETTKQLIEPQILSAFKNHPAGLPDMSVYIDGEGYTGKWNGIGALKRPKFKLATATPTDLQKTEAAKFWVWTTIPLDEIHGGKYSTKYSSKQSKQLTMQRFMQRKPFAVPDSEYDSFNYDHHEMRPEFPNIKVVPHKMIYSKKEATEFMLYCLKLGFEGIVLKKTEGLYKFGRSSCWLKMKPWADVTVKITDVFEGTGQHKHKMGAFAIQLPNGTFARVGTGLLDVHRERIWNNKEWWPGKLIDIKSQDDPKDIASIRFPAILRWSSHPDPKKSLKIRDDLNWKDIIESASQSLGGLIMTNPKWECIVRGRWETWRCEFENNIIGIIRKAKSGGMWNCSLTIQIGYPNITSDRRAATLEAGQTKINATYELLTNLIENREG